MLVPSGHAKDVWKRRIRRVSLVVRPRGLSTPSSSEPILIDYFDLVFTDCRCLAPFGPPAPSEHRRTFVVPTTTVLQGPLSQMCFFALVGGCKLVYFVLGYGPAVTRPSSQ